MLIGYSCFLNHSWVHISDLIILGVKELRKTSGILPPVEKANSEAIVEFGITKTSIANLDRIGNLFALSFHHQSKLKFPSSFKISSLKKISNFDRLLPPIPNSNYCFLNLAFNNDILVP